MAKTNAKNRWLKDYGLKHVTTSKGLYVYRKYLGNGRYAPQIALASIDATRREVVEAYEKCLERENNTILWLMDTYAQRKRAPKNLKNHHDITRALIRDWDDLPLTKITFALVQAYLDNAAPVAANRRVQHLNAAWEWGKRRHSQVPADNPCDGVEYNPETPRDRLVEQEEYDAVYKAALAQRNPWIAVMMELAYLCRMRMSETRELKRSDLTEEGVFVRRAKGSRGEITAWSPRLRAAIDLASAIHPDTISPYVIHNKDGRQLNRGQFNTGWRRAMIKAGFIIEQDGKTVQSATFTFHDIKAMGVTHHPEKESGHKSKKMNAVYDRLPKKTTPTR